MISGAGAREHLCQFGRVGSCWRWVRIRSVTRRSGGYGYGLLGCAAGFETFVEALSLGGGREIRVPAVCPGKASAGAARFAMAELGWLFGGRGGSPRRGS